MYSQLPSLRRKSAHFILFGYCFVVDIVRAFTRSLKLMLLYQRNKVITSLAKSQEFQLAQPKVLAIIPHITLPDEAENREKAFAKIDKLKNTIDGLLASFAHCELTIVVSTLSNRNITAYLPEYQINCINVQEEPDCDPMFVGFRIQEEFIKKVDDFDWFLFIEDDIILDDSYFLEKLEKFNQQCGYDHAVLLPNRYEFWEGTKRYIDLIIDSETAWNELTAVDIEGVKFAECTNPHSGFYCLSKIQMKQWIVSGRVWKNQVVMVGPLDSAATFCLLECFSLYKPHRSNLHYLEVKHYDTKYSQLHPEPSPYAFSPIKDSSQPRLPVN